MDRHYPSPDVERQAAPAPEVLELLRDCLDVFQDHAAGEDWLALDLYPAESGFQVQE